MLHLDQSKRHSKEKCITVPLKKHLRILLIVLLALLWLKKQILNWIAFNENCNRLFPISVLISSNTHEGRLPQLLNLKAIVVSTVFSVQLFSRVQLFVTPWTAACQASLSITNSRSLLKLMSNKLVMPSNHLIVKSTILGVFNLK